MSPHPPDPDAHAELRNALERDARRIQEPPFDPALHRATMRRIRSLAEPEAAPRRFLIPALGTCAGLLLVLVMLTRREPSPSQPALLATIDSAQESIASFSLETVAPLPAWISPTASLLQPPRLP